MNADDKTLWLGCLADYMDASFIIQAFRKMGEAVSSVKLAHDKYTGQFAQYCFVEFPSADAARRVILTVNGKVIPDSKPPITFKLSYAINPTDTSSQHSLIVSNLPNEFNDADLFSLFGKRYYSCRSAKIFRNPDGSTKGSGLVRFADVSEQKQALGELAGWKIQSRPLHIRVAYPKHGVSKMIMRRPYDPESYYKEHRDYYNSPQFQLYDYAAPAPTGPSVLPRRHVIAGPAFQTYGPRDDDDMDNDEISEAENRELEPYDLFSNIDEENEFYMEQSEELYLAAESSRWFFYNPTQFKETDLEKEALMYAGIEEPKQDETVVEPGSSEAQADQTKKADADQEAAQKSGEGETLVSAADGLVQCGGDSVTTAPAVSIAEHAPETSVS